MFLDKTEFEDEVSLYRTPALARIMPDLLHADDNASGAVRSRSGYVFPPFFVLERGTTLRTWLQEERSFDVSAMVEALAQLLARLHAAGYVHRDVKPANVVLLMQSTKWRMLDLGICARIGASSLRHCGIPWYTIV
jgi:serine/threonine protein kinase